MILCFKSLFLHYLVLTSIAAVGQVCNDQVFKDLRPCGHSEKYQQFTKFSGFFMDFNIAGRYCYSDSKKKLDKHLKWHKAREKCKSNGAILATFPEQKDWDDLVRENSGRAIYDYSDQYWLGGKSDRRTWYWEDTKNGKILVRWGLVRLPWNAGKPTHKSNIVDCMKAQNYLWWVGRCEDKQHFICQKEALGAYNTPLEFVSDSQKIHGTYFYKDESEVSISCLAKSEIGLKISFVTEKSGTHVVDSSEKETVVPAINVYDIVRNVTYLLNEVRCFRYLKLSLKLKMSNMMVNSRVTCSHIDGKYGYLNSSFSLAIQSEARTPIAPKDPVVEVPKIKQFEDTLQPSVGERIVYSCQAKPGDNNVMTFAISKGDQKWGMAVNIKAKSDTAGSPPPWLQDLAIKASPSNDNTRFISVTVEFVFIRQMFKASFGCYSRNATDNLGNLKKTDSLSKWITFTSGIKDVSSVLEIDDITGDMITGMEPAPRCKEFRVTCTGLGAYRDTISLKVLIGDEPNVWRFDSSREFTSFATITEVISFDDPDFGPSLKIVASFSVKPKMINAELQCVNVNMDTGEKQIDSKQFYMLLSEIGSMPPKLISTRHPSDDPETFLTLECVSGVGESSGQSWKIIDDKGHVNKVVINLDGDVSPISFPWLTIEFLRANRSSICGKSIASRLTMLKLSPKEFGVNFTCYSYNIESSAPLESVYNKTQLRATYVIFGGGILKVDKQSFLSYIWWFLALVVVTYCVSLILWYLAKKNKKQVRRLSNENATLNVGVQGNASKPSDFTKVVPKITQEAAWSGTSKSRSTTISASENSETTYMTMKTKSSWKSGKTAGSSSKL